MEGERGRGGKSQIFRGAERRGQPIPEPRFGRRVEGQLAGTRARRGQREAGRVREGVRRGARPGRGAKREGKAEKEPGKKEVAGRGT